MLDLKKLSTEENNINSKNIELLDCIDILKRINEEDKKVAYAISDNIEDISKLIEAILNRYTNNTRIIYIGAGTSGRLGIVDASECPPTFGTETHEFIGIIAGGKEANFQAKENVEDSEEEGEKDLKDINLNENDVVIGLAASGRTPYVKGALKYAKSIGALTGSISCSSNSEIKDIADYPINVITGPEIITGSTRMKAGTAQKMILNMISTTIMVKRGKVYSGYMVDVKTSNKKLVERAKNIIMRVTNCTYMEADEILLKANMDVKVAIIMKLFDIDILEAKDKLLKNNNNIARLVHEYIDEINKC